MRLIDHLGEKISNSFYKFQCLSPGRDDFVSIALQNIVTGCSCMVNQSCIKSALPFPPHVIMHDWWLAMVASRLGYLAFEVSPCVSYRQHSSNLVGADGYPFLLIKRIRLFLTLKLSKIMYLSIRQFQALVTLYPSSSTVEDILILNLTNPNRFVRIISALRLRLSKHGLLRTLVFYFLIFFSQPDLHT